MAKNITSAPRTILDGLRARPVRATLSLGVVLGFGAVGTMAFWTDTATVNTGTFSAGNLDLKVNDIDGPLAFTTFTASNLTPGESFAASFTVRNAGSVPFTYTATGTGAGTLAPRLQYTVRTGGTFGNTGSEAASNRVGSCTGGTTQATTQVLTAAAASVTPTAQQLAPAATQTFCVVARLDPNTPNPAPGSTQLTGTATFVLTANQLPNP